MAAGVTTKLWSLADMVRVIEDWEAARLAKPGDSGSEGSAIFLDDKLREQLPRQLKGIEILIMPYLLGELAPRLPRT